MNVSLTPELEAFVGELVRSGRSTAASEVIREGLRALRPHRPPGGGWGTALELVRAA